jgi:hypothetical protein
VKADSLPRCARDKHVESTGTKRLRNERGAFFAQAAIG